MQILFEQVGKRFGKHWLFKEITTDFKSGQRVGIEGANGSGKSTLLQIAAGISQPSQGKVSYRGKGFTSAEDLAGKLALVSPYTDVPEQLKLSELFNFHRRFIAFQEGVDLAKFCKRTLLTGKEDHLVKSFSSGMKQRLKLGLAFLSKASILMLDEPCSNLDLEGKELYQDFIQHHHADRLILIASNEAKTELIHITDRINLMDFKTG